MLTAEPWMMLGQTIALFLLLSGADRAAEDTYLTSDFANQRSMGTSNGKVQ